VDVRLPEQCVDEGGLAVVDVGDDGDVPDVGPAVLRGAYLGHTPSLLVTKKKTPRTPGVGVSIPEARRSIQALVPADGDAAMPPDA